MPNVTIIPATISRKTSSPITDNRKRKVAAYARVSTDQEEQQSSYETQVDYYTRYIKSREDWEFAGVFSDDGISGCDTKHRDGFNSMIAAALEGRIQLIITKSVSRFARNTVDSLTAIRKLKEHNVECYFEKEGLWTFDTKSEVILSIMSSLAQEESRSISENVKWGVRKKFETGKFSMPYSRFLGYDKGENNTLVINEKEAEIVRRIYGLFINGYSAYQIAKILTEDRIPTVTGKSIWNAAVIKSILSNEKYKGDALLQKQYTVSYLTKKMKNNMGEIPQYYVKNSHPAIIEPDVFDLVQNIMETKTGRGSATTFSGKIKCGECGSWYGSKVWHSNSKYRKVVYRCNHKYKSEKKCNTPHFDEEQIKEMFIRAVNIYCKEKEQIIKGFMEIKNKVYDTSALESREAELEDEMNTVSKLIEDITTRNISNIHEYEKVFNASTSRFENIIEELNAVKSKIKKLNSECSQLEFFFKKIKNLPDIITEFDEEAWYGLVDNITVYSDSDIRFKFKDGKEIKI